MILDLRRNPLPSSVVMLATMVTVVPTHDPAKGVIVGVLLSGIFFAGKVAKLLSVIRLEDKSSGAVTYGVEGQIFFASAESFVHAFDFSEAAKKVAIDVSDAHLWDIMTVGAVDKTNRETTP